MRKGRKRRAFAGGKPRPQAARRPGGQTGCARFGGSAAGPAAGLPPARTCPAPALRTLPQARTVGRSPFRLRRNTQAPPASAALRAAGAAPLPAPCTRFSSHLPPPPAETEKARPRQGAGRNAALFGGVVIKVALNVDDGGALIAAAAGQVAQ